MSEPLSRTRRLSSAWDNFRNKCRKTRIDSLLSPPNLDSGDDSKSFLSDSAGKLLSSDSDFYEEEAISPCDSKLPDLQFPPAISGFENEHENENESVGTSPDQDRRIAAAIDNVTVDSTEPEDIGSYFSRASRRDDHDGTISEQISPSGSMDTGVSANSTSGLLHSDNSGSTLDYEVGVPLQRTLANKNLQQWKTQVQTEPQTAEQSLTQSTYASLGEVVHDTGWMAEEQGKAKHKEREVPRTVDGVRLDARPLIRHTGTSAPPHSSLQLHTFASRQQYVEASDEGQVPLKKVSVTNLPEASKTQTLAAPSAQRRPQPISWFSSSSDSSVQSLRLNLTNQTYRRRSTLRPPLLQAQPQFPPSTSSHLPITSKRHRTTNESVLGVPPFPPISNTSNPSVTTSSTTYPPKPPRIAAPTSNPRHQNKLEYSHTPPSLPLQGRRGNNTKSIAAYTALSTPSAVSSFHNDLVARLSAAIDNGLIKASRVPVKERVRRISGARAMQQGVIASGRAVRRWSVGVGEWGQGFSEAVVAGGGLGPGWGDTGRDGERDVGARSAATYYGGGFI